MSYSQPVHPLALSDHSLCHIELVSLGWIHTPTENSWVQWKHQKYNTIFVYFWKFQPVTDATGLHWQL